MDKTRRYMLERVLGVLDPKEVSDERIAAFHDVAVLYREWRKELASESVAETVKK